MKKYLEIYSCLQKNIESGTYQVGSLLPGEHILAQEYQVSRETIRKALKELEVTGYIQKKQGKGSIVLNSSRYPFPVGSLKSFQELQASEQMDAKTVVLKNQIIAAPDFLVDAGFLEADESVIYLVRQRWIQGKPMIIDKDYLRLKLIGAISNEIAENSLYEYLEEQLQLHIAYAQKEFIGEHVTSEDKKYLAVGDDSHVMVVRSDVHLEDTTFIQYTESRHCLDKFRFVEFARRSK